MNLEGFFFKFESTLLRAWYKKTGRHPLSKPYISGDGFRSVCPREFLSDSSNGFDSDTTTPGALIYCRGDRLRSFLTETAPRIQVPFSIICNNDDTTLTPDWVPLFPPNMVRLFGQNVLIDDPRVIPLPIGLENARLHYNGVIRDYQALRRRPAPTRNRVLFAFTVGTNKAVRGPARAFLEKFSLADSLDRVNSRTYRKIASDYRFIASPPGNGVDCHRTWEAMYLRSVPIVVRSFMTEYFARLGLPLWLVDNYEELNSLTEADFDAKYRSLSPAFTNPALWSPYWESLIQSQSRPTP
ncbi:MAG: hypothetical protein WCT14_10820 [Treponemataceae bacterium]